MSVENTTTSQTYACDGSQTTFPIPFSFILAAQVSVKKVLISDSSEITLVEGVDYSLTGTEPGENVEMGTAPSALYQLVVARQTSQTQPYEFTDNGLNFPSTFEEALDWMVMMIQEGISSGTSTNSSELQRLSDQTLVDSDIITISSTVKRAYKKVSGTSGPATANATTPIEDGTIDGQELILVGDSDTNPLTLEDSGNVRLNGQLTLGNGDSAHLLWVPTKSKWLVQARSR